MKKIHFIGIGGIGMSGLADIALSEGNIVTGSDLRPNDLTGKLSGRGAVIFKGHSADNFPRETDLVVRSTCIKDDNPEIIRAKELRVPVISRGERLRRTMGKYGFSLAVTGTHGKTTTSALIAHIAEDCGKDPTVIVGGEMESFGGNAKFGRGNVIVVEVDESDGFFRNISSTCACVTNIEREHMEYYGSMEDLMDAYTEFAGRISQAGMFVYNGEDPALNAVARRTSAGKIDFGMDGDFCVTCRNVSYSRSIEFDLVVNGKVHGRVLSPLIGRYNVMNVLGAVAACTGAGFDPERILEAVRSFRGVRRRFDTVGNAGNIRVIEDYAHHPTELRSVIDAARDYGPGRVVVVFQPHRYSRTRDLLTGFSECFYGSDALILTGIYSADEEVIGDIGIADIYRAIDRKKFDLVEIVEKEEIPGFVSGIVKENDMVLVLGAGDISELAAPILEAISKPGS
ncbi:MAG: UDP-N-acetylmuramate--L-alanine ligase [Candidatus Omnitrophota bacterium]|nr:UDP-N-acetylmuramate--L-alanine ligase [Candidatus Omnitrophota bacterium]